MITGKFKNYLLHANNLLANLTLLCARFKAPNNVYEKKKTQQQCQFPEIMT